MSKPPLWQVLMNAGDPPCTMQEMAAAEIRALRDWLVPEGEREPKCKELTYEWVQWNKRQRLRTLLTAEANRAERGEVEA